MTIHVLKMAKWHRTAITNGDIGAKKAVIMTRAEEISMGTFMRYLLSLISGCLLFTSLVFAAEPSKSLPADVRVIIDISGSMKKTDPENLRKPAVDLIVRLLPDSSKAGLWTFGQSVNMLMPHRVVDPAWRSQSVQKATAINSAGLFTNIGAALEKATEDYAAPEQNYRRNIILLTDGVVDVSKEAVDNLNERKRILTELLPRLKAAGYRIHTIALSADADQELMKKLSLATDGIFEVAETADELMSTFLRIFDQAVPAERVPLDENGFLVDDSIQEFTALIFRRADVPATVIIAPDGKEYSSTDVSNNVNWYRTEKYDLITVQQPVAGQWKIKTEMEPASRVTVVSDLQLAVAPIKNLFRVNQSFELAYSFQENNQVITNNDFLSLLTGKILLAKVDGLGASEIDIAKSASADGVFRQTLNGADAPGEYDLRLMIDGKTFKREYVHHFNVTDAAFRLEKRIDDASGQQRNVYKLIADVEMVDVDTLNVNVTVSNSLGNQQEQLLNSIAKEYWEFSFIPVQTARYDIEMQAEGKYLDGSPLSETIKADQFYFPDEASVLAAEQASSSATASTASEPDPLMAVPEEAESEPVANNLWLYIGIGVGNLLVLVLGYVVYRLIVGGDKGELAQIEKSLAKDNAAVKPDVPKKTTIDVSDDETAHIPMNDTSTAEASMADDLMADNLFPLDNMDESDGDKK